MIHRQEEQEAIEGMDFWKALSKGKRSRKVLTLTELVLLGILNDIIDERADELPRNERGFTGGNTQRYNKMLRGEKTTVPKYRRKK